MGEEKPEEEGKTARPRRPFRLPKITFRRGILHFMVPFIAGMATLLAMRSPMVEASIIGQPDREMMETAFQIRADVVRHLADPLLLIDIDDESVTQEMKDRGWPKAPSSSAPRGLVASVLSYALSAPPGRTPTAVILDVDIANKTDDVAGEARLRAVLQKWQASPSAPLLIVSREAMPPTAVGLKGKDWILPTSPYDDIVEAPGSKIKWGSARVLADRWGLVRWFQPVECVSTHTGTRPLYSAAILAYLASAQHSVPANAPIRRWLKTDCKPGNRPDLEAPQGELINYHMSLTEGEEAPVWKDLAKDWPGYRACDQNGGAPMAQVLSAATVAEAGPDADTGILCRRLMIVGGTNGIALDFQNTPVHEMAGVMILANAARGLQLSNGGLKRVPFILQLLTIYVVSTIIWLGFRATESVRSHYRNLRTTLRQRHWVIQLRSLPMNPVVLHWIFAFASYWLGVFLLLRALDLGYWGYLSAPAFAAATAGLIEEVADETKELEEKISEDEAALAVLTSND